MADIEKVTHYHDRTKHRFDRYARGPGGLDWANQPDPFRRFAGAPLIELPLIDEDQSPPFSDLFGGRVAASSLNAATLGAFLECSLGLSAWKSHGGTRWALRCNPSSGNLHPTEGYVVCNAIAGVTDTPAVCHYAPREHALEARCVLSADVWRSLTFQLPADSFLVALTSIHWREAWKYGERAFRYCQHDVGHALAALSYSAAALGWRVTVCDAWSDDAIERLVGLDRQADFAEAEQEHPDLLAVVTTSGEAAGAMHLPDSADIAELGSGAWSGSANRLSPTHVDWPIIDEVAQSCRKPQTSPSATTPSDIDAGSPICQHSIQSWDLFKQRRSAVAMDGKTTLSAAAFCHILAQTMPSGRRPPFCSSRREPAVHLLLFVHRVDGLQPGLYCLPRTPAAVPELKQAMTRDWQWTNPDGVPPELPLHCLHPCDSREAAMTLACGQDIASDGVFSLAMICAYEDTIERFGPWAYRQLFWETGMIGQVLYLEAEAAGFSGTGIGCFFDDAVHELAGLHGHTFQSLYHFAVGRGIVDTRLTTLPPYER